MYGASQAGLTCKESFWADWSSVIEVVAAIGVGCDDAISGWRLVPARRRVWGTCSLHYSSRK
ncbi:hypothetical protein A6X21_21500 [Planctopirus hydrillae]|uniref:Uncharacterized protein n=1 Tax=Planctopirus hydrillae TaxID=1841610 RepID=A0A1C3EFR0_9PLAN|nr:hypothetical protein A6X21_21500 [Planctopirus hydrillae]